jgi:hypothetical protein
VGGVLPLWTKKKIGSPRVESMMTSKVKKKMKDTIFTGGFVQSASEICVFVKLQSDWCVCKATVKL